MSTASRPGRAALAALRPRSLTMLSVTWLVLAAGASVCAPRAAAQSPALAPYPSHVLSDGPRAYWRLGETTGTTAADELGGAPGTLLSGVALGVPGAIAGDANTGTRFDGSNDRISMGDPAVGTLDFGTGDFTVELWLKTALNQEKAAISKQGTTSYWHVTVTDDPGRVGQIRAKIFDGVVVRQAYGPPVRVDDSAWHHVVVVYDRDTGIVVYVDGIAQATAGPMAGDVSNTTELLLGKAGGYAYYKGELDEAAVYPSALPADRIRAHHDIGRTGGGGPPPPPPPDTTPPET
ncbi:MAG: LamG domain-containing protein, partial [Nocardioidaceae bacterium]